MRQLQVRLQRLALPDMKNQILEGQGNSLKGIDKKTVIYIFSKNYFLNGNHIWPTLFVKSDFCFKLKLFNLRKKYY